MGFAVESFEAACQDGRAVEAASFVLALRSRGLRSTAVLGAMERVRRELFAPRRVQDLARSDVALPLPCGEVMTAPGVVGAMLEALGVEPGQRALEIGTGSGYVTALLVQMGARAHTIERHAELAEAAARRLVAAGLAGGVRMEIGDGLIPRRFEAPFERILLNGAVAETPQALLPRLALGGRLVGALARGGIPRLLRIDRDKDGFVQRLGAPLRVTALAEGPRS